MLSLHNIHFVLEDVISHVQHENVIQRFITGCFHLLIMMIVRINLENPPNQYREIFESISRVMK